MTGILAIWNDCAPGNETAYEEWYQDQHLPERVGIPGFLRGRRYRAVGPGPQYFSYYETTTPGVLHSAAYLNRVNNPTPETKHIMGHIFQNMSRTICSVTAGFGEMRGSVAVTWMAGGPEGRDLLARVKRERTPRVARGEFWEAIDDDTQMNAEQALRGPDQTVPGAEMAECLDEPAARQLADALGPTAMGSPRIYQLLCELQAWDPRWAETPPSQSAT